MYRSCIQCSFFAHSLSLVVCNLLELDACFGREVYCLLDYYVSFFIYLYNVFIQNVLNVLNISVFVCMCVNEYLQISANALLFGTCGVHAMVARA